MSDIENINSFFDKDKRENSKKYAIIQSTHGSSIDYHSFSSAVMHCEKPFTTSSPIIKIIDVKDHYNGEKSLGFSCLTNLTNSNQITKPTPVTFQNQNVTEIDSSLSKILQIELSLKMFPEKIVPYLNSLKHDILQLMNNNRSYQQMTSESKTINNIIRNSFVVMKLNKNTCVDFKPIKIHQSTLSLINIDFNALNILNDNLEHVNKILELVKWTLNDQKEVKKSVKDLNSLKYYDFFKNHNSHNLDDLKLPELAKSNLDTINDTFSSIHQPEANDSFNHMRQLSRSNTLLPSFNNSIVFHESFQDKSFENNSLKYVNEQTDTEFVTPVISSVDVKCTLNHQKSDNLDDLKLSELVKSNVDTINDTFSSIHQPEANDSFKHMRHLSRSSTLRPSSNNSIVFHESSKDESLENNSLKHVNEQTDTEFVTPDTSSSRKNPQVEALSTKSHSRYCLRRHPKSTDHYYVPFKLSSLIKKPKRIVKTKYKDLFACGGTGKNKKILHFKVHSVLKTNSSELMKKICPENNNHNTNTCNISNLKPKKNGKPCLCGIFPSQVPSSWNNSLHRSIHQNLHRLRFNSQTTEKNIVIKCNGNGFLYDIIKIPENCDIDKNLKLTLKNVQDFINLELNYSNSTIKNNYSTYLAVHPDSKIIGYLEVELLNSACVYQNNQISSDLVAVKFGVSKLWVMVKYRNNRVAARLLKQLCEDENLKTNDIAFAFYGNHGISFIKKFYANNSILIY